MRSTTWRLPLMVGFAGLGQPAAGLADGQGGEIVTQRESGQ